MRTALLLCTSLALACVGPQTGQSGSDLDCSTGPVGDAFCIENHGPDSQCNSSGICEAPVGNIEASMVPNPSTFSFFQLPINSIRSAVSAYDADRNLCVSVIWAFDSLADELEEHCDDFGQSSPYVLVTSSTDPNCGQWSFGYGEDDLVLSADGCIDFDFDDPDNNSVDINLKVSGPLFSGEIHLSN